MTHKLPRAFQFHTHAQRHTHMPSSGSVAIKFIHWVYGVKSWHSLQRLNFGAVFKRGIPKGSFIKYITHNRGEWGEFEEKHERDKNGARKGERANRKS